MAFPTSWSVWIRMQSCCKPPQPCRCIHHCQTLSNLNVREIIFGSSTIFNWRICHSPVIYRYMNGARLHMNHQKKWLNPFLIFLSNGNPPEHLSGDCLNSGARLTKRSMYNFYNPDLRSVKISWLKASFSASSITLPHSREVAFILLNTLIIFTSSAVSRLVRTFDSDRLQFPEHT